MRLNFATSILLTLFLSVSSAYADEPISVTLEPFSISQETSGEEILQSTDTVDPGEVLEYRLTMSNNDKCVEQNSGDCALQGVVATAPIPEGTTYLGDSASTVQGASLEVSIDGGQTWEAEPVVRMIEEEDGSSRNVVISPTKYTNLRWLLEEPLTPEKKKVFTYRVLVQ